MAVKHGTYRGMTLEQRRAQRRTRLIDAVVGVWGTADGPPITMTRVCSAAGLSERYFYESFADLDAALVATIELLADEVAQACAEAVDAHVDPSRRVRAGLATLVRLLVEDPRRGHVSMVAAPSHPATRSRRAELLEGLRTFVVAEARAVHGETARSGDDAFVAASMFLGGVGQLLTDHLEGRLDLAPEQIVDAAGRLWHGTMLR
ncbi:transcriptional regulator [Aeromicrobium halocynthiae]|uniref:Transcriptional regulator n=1 Tax=Aeromicrobium halocynthiae TaxID=560557 RepID=A0ABN2W9H0_9ACTN